MPTTTVFVSYARTDDDDGRISDLINEISVAYKRVTGDPLNCFIDTHSIEAADQWQQKVDTGLQNSVLMFAFLSPSYFRSKWCGWEWDHYIDKGKKQDGLIYPFIIQSYDKIRDFAPDEQRRVEQANSIQILNRPGYSGGFFT